MRVALDTNRYVDLCKGVKETVEIAETADEVFLPFVVVAELRAGGLTRVEARLYPDARHELLNETNRDAVTLELRAWLRGALGISL